MDSVPIAAFDIETVPDPEFGRRSMGFNGSDSEVIQAMAAHRLKETDGKTSESPAENHVDRLRIAQGGMLSGSTDAYSLTDALSRLSRNRGPWCCNEVLAIA